MSIMNVEYEVIHAVPYFQRELFLLKIENRYTMVYKGSGLNGGAVGRVLPFHFLMDRQPRFGEARSGIVAGYIFKEFYFHREIRSHRKRVSEFGEGVSLFCERLTNELDDYYVKPTEDEQDINDVLKYAKSFNSIVNNFMNVDNRFDWSVLNIYHNIAMKQEESNGN